MVLPRPAHLFSRSISCLCLILLLAAVAGSAAAEAQVRVLSVEPGRMTFEVRFEPAVMNPVQADGRACVLPTMDGEAMLMDAGAPQLPVVRRAFAIDDMANVDVRVIETSYALRAVSKPVVPSKGHLTRAADPGTIPFKFGATYVTDAFYPAENALLHEPFVLRDVRGVVVEMHPVRFNPVSNQIEIATRMVLEISEVPGAPVNPCTGGSGRRDIDPEFDPIYANTFANWQSMRDRYTVLEEPGRCLILTADAFYDQVLPLARWHMQKGIPTIVTRLSDVGATATAVKAYIQNLYDDPEGLTYIVLVGDSSQMPYLRGTAENAPSDPMYVKLAGSDHYPDALISRISAQTATQVETQVARSIRYEKTPDVGAAGDWYDKGCGVASQAYGGGAYDWQRADWLRATLLGYRYTSVDQIYDPTATKQMITSAINEGRSFVNYIGHGATTYWVTTGFNVQDVYNLSNGFKNPYICDVACVNGDFTYGECFAEAWMRAGTAVAPKGAIGIYAASTNASWVPPCDMQTEVVRLLTEEERNTLGGLSFNGVAKAMDLWPGYEGTKLMEQYHLFGDCTIMIRSDNPTDLAVDCPATIVLGQPSFGFSTAGVAGARGALYADGVLYGSALTDAQGNGTIAIDPLPPAGTQVTFTVTAYNKVPAIRTLPVAPAIDATLEIAEWLWEDAAAEAGKATGIDIALRNLGPDDAHGVVGEISAIGGTATVQDATADYGVVGSGSAAWGMDPYRFTPDPDAPDGSMIDLAVEIGSSDYLAWHDTLNVPVRGPEYAFQEAIVTDPQGNRNGRLDSGETGLVTVAIANTGSARADELTASLVSMDPRVRVVSGTAGMDSLCSGDTAYLASAFEVELQSSFPRESMAAFRLRVVTGVGRTRTIAFELPVGGFFENVETGAPGFAHAAPEGFVDDWDLRPEANHTPGGSMSFACGDTTSGYAPLNDASLTTPIVLLAGEGRLTFWHKMHAEVDTLDAHVAFDGGVIEVSNAGGPFVQVTPDQGYGCVIADRGEGGPFPAGTPCFGGSFAWSKVEVDLSGLVGAVQVRFRFGSDGSGGGAGWTIDDIEVRGTDTTVDVDDETPRAVATRMLPAQPNPCDGRTLLELTVPAASAVQLSIYDAAGRHVRTLVESRAISGTESIVWDCMDDANRAMPSGVYYAVLETGSGRQTERIVLVR